MTDPNTLDQLNRALSGRYHVERPLGTGGMATVYLAEDLKHHRHVAIKVLRPELAAAIGSQRFAQEIAIAAFHRDVKPENILLHEGEALVTDFGIALAVSEAGGERLTRTGLPPCARSLPEGRYACQPIRVQHESSDTHLHFCTGIRRVR